MVDGRPGTTPALDAALAWLRDFADTPPSEWAYHASVILAERERLRAALEKIAEPQAWKRGDRVPFEVAREALYGK